MKLFLVAYADANGNAQSVMFYNCDDGDQPDTDTISNRMIPKLVDYPADAPFLIIELPHGLSPRTVDQHGDEAPMYFEEL